MRIFAFGVVCAGLLTMCWGQGMADYRSYPFPNELTAAAGGQRIAWAMNEQGARNIWAAEGPDWRARRLTAYMEDDGQELTSVSISRDGKYVVYVRGGEHGSNWEVSVGVNPGSRPEGGKVQIWSVAFAGGEPKLLGDGDSPVISPRGDVVAYEKDKGIWVAPLEGGKPGKKMFSARGDLGGAAYSPDGGKLAFVSGRGDHSFIGVYRGDDKPILWLAPSTGRDSSPRWSRDGKNIAFVRRPGAGGAPELILQRRSTPWSIWRADAETGQGRRLWASGKGLRDSPPTTHGGANLHWGAGRIAFLSYADGWPHLYSIPEDGGAALALTPGNFMVEYITMSPDGKYLVGAANTGPSSLDIDRRHILRIPLDGGAKVLTPGEGLEWTPVVTGDGARIAYLSATASRPPLPAVMAEDGSGQNLLAESAIPAKLPIAKMVTPRQVKFKASDGVEIHGQIFASAGGAPKKPAIVYIHGGPPRQMLLGWHYSDYYANAYAMNQYLAGRGYVVLSVNYRLGIGYGHDFHVPPNAGAQGASEYLDIRAAGEYLKTLPGVDGTRIGVYGGSYGGFLTAMALGKDSNLFAAGVDIHGVHNWTAERARPLLEPAYEKAPDTQAALDVAWKSSPVAWIGGWKSPVLLLHADDDRNVRFSQTVDLVQRLEKAGVPHEEIVIPDDTHHFLRHANGEIVAEAMAEFFDRKLMNK